MRMCYYGQVGILTFCCFFRNFNIELCLRLLIGHIFFTNVIKGGIGLLFKYYRVQFLVRITWKVYSDLRLPLIASRPELMLPFSSYTVCIQAREDCTFHLMLRAHENL